MQEEGIPYKEHQLLLRLPAAHSPFPEINDLADQASEIYKTMNVFAGVSESFGRYIDTQMLE